MIFSSLKYTLAWRIDINLELVCCKKHQKKLQNRGPPMDLNDSKLILHEFKWFPWSSRINFIPFRIFRGPLIHKPVTGQEPFFLLFLTANWLWKLFVLKVFLSNFMKKSVVKLSNFCQHTACPFNFPLNKRGYFISETSIRI